MAPTVLSCEQLATAIQLQVLRSLAAPDPHMPTASDGGACTRLCTRASHKPEWQSLQHSRHVQPACLQLLATVRRGDRPPAGRTCFDDAYRHEDSVNIAKRK